MGAVSTQALVLAALAAHLPFFACMAGGDDDGVSERIREYLQEHLLEAFQCLGFVDVELRVVLGGSRFTGLFHADSENDLFCGVPHYMAIRACEARQLLAASLEKACLIKGWCTDQRANQTLKFMDCEVRETHEHGKRVEKKNFVSLKVCEENDPTLAQCRTISLRLQEFYARELGFQERYCGSRQRASSSGLRVAGGEVSFSRFEVGHCARVVRRLVGPVAWSASKQG